MTVDQAFCDLMLSSSCFGRGVCPSPPCACAQSLIDRCASEMGQVLSECAEYFDGRADVIDGDYGQPRPNREMQLLQRIKSVL